jgi:tetratricopeptide (TPR) repeat protein
VSAVEYYNGKRELPGGRIWQMILRTIICPCVAVVLATISLSAQNVPSRRQTRSVVDPVELSGPPKKPIVLTPAKRAFAQSAVMEQLNSKDPSVLATALREITSFIKQDPTDTDFFLMRATVSCEIAGSSKEEILRDINTSIKLWKPDQNSAFDSLGNHYAQKAKVEFLLGRYADAMNDLDAGMRTDYSGAERMFNNGNVKPDEPTAIPCMWSQPDVNKLAELFPKDYRTSLYGGLYRLEFSNYSLDTDYQPILKSFEHAAELNPSSAVPPYFNAYPYVYGGMGGLMSNANARCLDDVVPRTKPCLDLDEIHRTGVRYLTKAIAADPTFEPAYALRAAAHLKLRENRQAVRDYTKALELDPKAHLYQDRASAESELKEYQAAILDYTKGIAQGCENGLCMAYEYRADVYLKLHDYPHAISDLGHAIRNFLAGTIYGFNIDQFRRMYPEYDDVADEVLCEKIRALFYPQMSYADYSKQFLVNATEVDDFVLPELFVKRGDAYADMGDFARANREYDRVSAGYPKWAVNEFTIRNGKRIRVRQ